MRGFDQEPWVGDEDEGLPLPPDVRPRGAPAWAARGVAPVAPADAVPARAEPVALVVPVEVPVDGVLLVRGDALDWARRVVLRLRAGQKFSRFTVQAAHEALRMPVPDGWR